MRAPLQLLFSPADQHEDVERRLHMSYGSFQGPPKITELRYLLNYITVKCHVNFDLHWSCQHYFSA